MNKIYLNGKTYTYTSIVFNGNKITIDGKRINISNPKPAIVSSLQYGYTRK